MNTMTFSLSRLTASAFLATALASACGQAPSDIDLSSADTHETDSASDESGDAWGSSDTIAHSRSALIGDTIPDLHPQIRSYDPLAILMPGGELVTALNAELEASRGEFTQRSRGQEADVDEIYTELGDGRITVHAKGHGKIRSCNKVFGRWVCSPWLETGNIRITVAVGLSIDNWTVNANHIWTDIDVANDALRPIFNTFGGSVYDKITNAVKKKLASQDGRNLRTELEQALQVTLPPEGRVDVTVSPEGVLFRAS